MNVTLDVDDVVEQATNQDETRVNRVSFFDCF